jgi:hypothetical protein
VEVLVVVRLVVLQDKGIVVVQVVVLADILQLI